LILKIFFHKYTWSYGYYRIIRVFVR
jgi:hypothetical protein